MHRLPDGLRRERQLEHRLFFSRRQRTSPHREHTFWSSGGVAEWISIQELRNLPQLALLIESVIDDIIMSVGFLYIA